MSRARRFADKGNLHSLVLNATDGSATDASEKILLDGTDTSASNAGFTILLEDATGNADVEVTSQLDNGVFNFTSLPTNDTRPMFRVSLNSNQTNSNATVSTIQYNQIDYDIGGGWDSSNYYYKPNVPGYYNLTAQYADIGSTDVYQIICYFYLNDETYLNWGRYYWQTNQSNEDLYGTSVSINSIHYLNGDSDFIKVRSLGNSEDSQNVTVQGITTITYFTGHLIQRTRNPRNLGKASYA